MRPLLIEDLNKVVGTQPGVSWCVWESAWTYLGSYKRPEFGNLIEMVRHSKLFVWKIKFTETEIGGQITLASSNWVGARKKEDDSDVPKKERDL